MHGVVGAAKRARDGGGVRHGEAHGCEHRARHDRQQLEHGPVPAAEDGAAVDEHDGRRHVVAPDLVRPEQLLVPDAPERECAVRADGPEREVVDAKSNTTSGVGIVNTAPTCGSSDCATGAPLYAGSASMMVSRSMLLSDATAGRSGCFGCHLTNCIGSNSADGTGRVGSYRHEGNR
jgi:hypothetical protein